MIAGQPVACWRVGTSRARGSMVALAGLMRGRVRLNRTTGRCAAQGAIGYVLLRDKIA